MVPEERAGDFRQKPAYLLGAAVGSGHRTGAIPHNSPLYACASFETVAPDLYRMAGLGPSDVGVVQANENFTGGVAMALADHGFFNPDEANEFLRLENLIAPSGRLPLNTSGGNLAECYMHAGARGRAPGAWYLDQSGDAKRGGDGHRRRRPAISFSAQRRRYEWPQKSDLSSRRLPIPVAEPDGLSAPYWAGLRESRLMAQRCSHCDSWQFGPEWVCHRCHASIPNGSRSNHAAGSSVGSASGIPPTPRSGTMVHTSPSWWRYLMPAACE
ncbi:thiolase C-terminal domain-containing protein [Bradyrhizobium diazoefficiens]|uniref:thiolase C-terminal domain-containing protein n=1 Tax=Bradyrhizobium diazoefficiens TaxID=1355477 RepID=UPI003908BAC4